MCDLTKESIRSYKKELKKIIKKAKHTIAELDEVLKDDEESFDHYQGTYKVQDDYKLKVDGVGEFVLLPFKENIGEMATVRVDNNGYYAIIGINRFELIDSQYAGYRVEERLSINDHCSFVDKLHKYQQTETFKQKLKRLEKGFKTTKKL